MAIDILSFFFDSARHFIQLCIVLILVCPWHWTNTKKYMFKFLKDEKPKEEKKELVAHS